jgi:hypothetical protein
MRHNPPECALVFAVGEPKMQMECGLCLSQTYWLAVDRESGDADQ